MQINMASGKYANLPGIDNQPDVFETPDVDERENEQNGTQGMEDEHIQLLEVDTQEAYNKFKGKYLDSSGLDFSETLGPHRRKGYATKTEYEILADGNSKETPDQKYQRLQHEMRELAEELEQIKGTFQEEKEEKKVSPVILAQEVKTLQQQLHDLHLEKILGNEVVSGSTAPQGGLPQRLQTQLEAFKTLDVKQEPSKQAGGECVTYELFYKPEHAKFNQLSKTSDLEQRIQKLEKVLGHDSAHLSSITADLEIKEKGLLAGSVALQAKLALLDANHLEHMDARLQGVLHHVTQLSEKKEQVENAAKQSKVTELYDLLNKFDSVVNVVPDLVERLHSLKALHDQAAQFGQSLVQLDTSQTNVSTQIQTQKRLLQELDASFTSNMAVIESNCSKVEARVAALLEKFEKRGR